MNESRISLQLNSLYLQYVNLFNNYLQPSTCMHHIVFQHLHN